MSTPVARAPLGGEPQLILGFVSAAVSLLVALNVGGLTDTVGALIVALITAVFGAVAAAMVRPVAPAAFTTVVTAAADLLLGLHYNVDPGVVAAINGLVLAVLVLVTRHQVTPVPLTRADVSQAA
jgi:hypothetical protein